MELPVVCRTFCAAEGAESEVTKMIKPRYLLMLALGAVTGCSAGGPSEWALTLEKQLKCGMAVAEVEALTDREIELDQWQHPWATNVILGDLGHPEMYLGFPDGRLDSFQIEWTYSLTGVASYSRVDLCQGEGAELPPSGVWDNS